MHDPRPLPLRVGVWDAQGGDGERSGDSAERASA